MNLLTLKHTNMKKILFAAVAALAITSCSQNEMDGIDNGQKGKAEIRFGYTPVTRATVTTTNSLGNFTVNAYSSDGATYSTDALDVISNGYFTKKNGEDVWESTEKYYWPVGKKMHFFGYDTTSSEATFTKETAGYPTLKYTTWPDITSQHDLLVAKLENQEYSTTNAVSLPFKHALTQVLFNLKGDDETVTYTVKSVAINGVFKDGKYNYETGIWTDHINKEETGYVATPTNATVVNGTTATLLGTYTDNNDYNSTTLMLMPQTVPDDATIVVTYSATKKYGDVDTEIHAESNPITVSLGGKTWTEGKKTTYTLILSGDKVKIDGKIDTSDDWATNGDSDIDINK